MWPHTTALIPKQLFNNEARNLKAVFQSLIGVIWEKKEQ